MTAQVASRGRVALRVAYVGSGFSGWQTQPSGDSVQDALERALAAVAGAPVRTTCAGRTDAGVHATAQVVHFDAPTDRPLSAWVRGANAHLPEHVAVHHALSVDGEFHARYGATRRAYCYLIHRSPTRDPISARRAGWVFRPLDVARLAEASRALVGEHDFSAFRSSQCQARSPVRRLERIDVSEHGPMLVLELCADAFLHHMVRNIVGALVSVGIGRHPPAWVGDVLGSRDRRLAAPTFAADGLYLTGVEYASRYDLGSWPPRRPAAAGF